MLLGLIAIKFGEFAKMMHEVLRQESYRAYARELGVALKLEFVELNLVAAMREEVYTLRAKLGLIKQGIQEEVTAFTPLAGKAVAAAKEFKAHLQAKTSQ